MRIRDSYAALYGDKTEYEMPSGGLEIIADDGRALFEIALAKDGSINISTSSIVKHNGVILDSRPIIRLQAANCFYVFREKY